MCRAFQILMRAKSRVTERALNCSSSARTPAGVSPSRRPFGESLGWMPMCAMIPADVVASSRLRVTICVCSTRASTNPNATIGSRLSSAT